MATIELSRLTAGYRKRTVLRQISLRFSPGRMTCILGANGAGKTTLLKTVAQVIEPLEGRVLLDGRDVRQITARQYARRVAAVLTGRVQLEHMTGFDAAAMGRYPHTGLFGVLSSGDRAAVRESLSRCGARELHDRLFDEMSDGEKQKVLLARGLCQDPEILLLDEPTSHLDIRYKLELLLTLRELCAKHGKTVICTLHEPDLAVKCCDELVLVQDDKILAHGATGDVVRSGALDRLYGLANGEFNAAAGLTEFSCAAPAKIFVLGADAATPALMRALCRARVGFAGGVLPENDLACHIARTMGAPVVTTGAFEPMDEERIGRAFALALPCEVVAMANIPRCAATEGDFLLAERLREAGKQVVPAAELLLRYGG